MKEKMALLQKDIAKMEGIDDQEVKGKSTYPSPIERNITIAGNIKPVVKSVTKTLQETHGGNKKQDVEKLRDSKNKRQVADQKKDSTPPVAQQSTA